MSSEFQTIAALIVVAVAATWLIWRSLAKKKNGCAGDCGCEATELKAKLKR